jgi:hypothetical protein
VFVNKHAILQQLWQDVSAARRVYRSLDIIAGAMYSVSVWMSGKVPVVDADLGELNRFQPHPPLRYGCSLY